MLNAIHLATLWLTMLLSEVGLTRLDVVEVASDKITISDVVELASVRKEIADAVGALVVARFPENVDEVTLSRADLHKLVSRRVPAFQKMTLANGGGEILFRRPEQSSVAPSATAKCWSAFRGLSKGAAISHADARAEPCKAIRSAARLRYDRHCRCIVADADIEPGAYLGRLVFPPVSHIAPGEPLRLVSYRGVVAIERDVSALQSADEGGFVFVRDADGGAKRVPVFRRKEGWGVLKISE